MRPSQIVSATLMACACTAGIPAADLAGLEFHGFYSQAYVKTSANEYLADQSQRGSFDVAEIGLNAGWQATDRLRLSVQVFAKDLWSGDRQSVNSGSFTGKNAARASLDLAFAQYSAADEFGIRAGRIKQYYGFYNDVRDLDVARTPALLPQAVYDERDREYNFAINGLGVFGNLDVGKAGSVEYNLYGGKVYTPANGAVGGQYATPDIGLSEIKTKWTAGGQLLWSPPIDGVRLGVSYRQHHGQTAGAFVRDRILVGTIPAPTYIETTSFDATMDRVHNLLLSIEYTRDDFTFQGEYQRIKTTRQYSDMTLVVPLASLSFPRPLSNDYINSEGWYAMATYGLSDRLTVGAYASIWANDYNNRMGDSDSDINAWQHDYALLSRFDVTSWCTLKLEGHYVYGTSLLDVPNKQTGHLNTAPTGEDNWYYVVARSTFSF